MTDWERRWYGDPTVHVLASAILISAAEVFLKMGAAASADVAGVALLGVAALAAPATWIGIAFYILSFLSWLHVLRLMPVSQAFALSNIVHVMVPVAAFLFLGEAISLQRGAGILLVFAGTLLVATSPAVARKPS